MKISFKHVQFLFIHSFHKFQNDILIFFKPFTSIQLSIFGFVFLINANFNLIALKQPFPGNYFNVKITFFGLMKIKKYRISSVKINFVIRRARLCRRFMLKYFKPLLILKGISNLTIVCNLLVTLRFLAPSQNPSFSTTRPQTSLNELRL